uniref:Uncharacterized protein n=1 Tax=Opuntia streptacantha TaxID=393608 RepID=A0A7C9EN02_OPUST
MLRSISMVDLSLSQDIDHIRQNKTNTEQHIAYASASKNSKNAPFLAKTASPESSCSPPGSVNPAWNVMAARSVATTNSTSRSFKKYSARCAYVSFSVGSILARLHNSDHS